MINTTLACALLLFAPLLGAATPQLQTFVQRQTRGVSRTTCNDVYPEPTVPTTLPTWASASIDDLRADTTVQEIGSYGVFRKNDEIVIKTCTTRAFEDTVDHAKPRVNQGTAHLSIDIYFGCDRGSEHVIRVKREMHFGTPADNTSGTFRLLAPYFNVVLNGETKTRILKANRYSHLTLYGLVIRDGYMHDMEADIDEIVAGGYGGSAVLASFRSTVVVYKCEFYNNHSRSRFARWSSGGAIMAETGARLYVWGSYFKSNRATCGGAIATSSAQIVYIVSTTFESNVALGGYDMSKSKTVNGVTKPVLQIRGGALRVDSVTGHDESSEHVFVCNSEFVRNKLQMSNDMIQSFGYEADEAGYLFAGASAFELWNKQGNLNLGQGDRNLLTMKGCVFDDNFEELPWRDDRAGRYVFEARGAGHIDILDTSFVNNSVQKAVAGLDNSRDFFTEYDYDLMMRRVHFANNGAIPTVRFAVKQHTQCDVQDVDGMEDGTGDCISLIS